MVHQLLNLFSKNQLSKVVQSGGFLFNITPTKFYGKRITLKNNKIKEFMKVIKSSEKRNFTKRDYYKKCFSGENDSWFTINEKCTHFIS